MSVGAGEGGSGERSGAWRRQTLPQRQEDPLPDCGARAPGRAGGAAAACVGGRASRRRAAAGWTWEPRCCPLAPIPATPRMAPITSPRPVSSAGGESSLPCAGGVGNGKVSPLSQTAPETLLQFLGRRPAVRFVGRGRQGGGAGRGSWGGGREEGKGAFRSGRGWWPAGDGDRGRLTQEFQMLCRKKFQAGKASRRSQRMVCEERGEAHSFTDPLVFLLKLQ